MKIKYEEKKFSAATLGIIDAGERIIEQYQAQGFTLTLRQLYYQFVARALLQNTDQNYKKLGNIISDARRAGLIDWNAIEDRTRYLRSNSFWSNPQSILESARDSYHRDLWANQEKRLEVWIEKDALVGVIENICKKNDVPFFSCRGYVSDSEIWRAARRHLGYIKKKQKVIVLHLGDHDPSGIDMTRDIRDRIRLFTAWDENIEVRRIALTMMQIEELNPPPNPAKITDSRYAGYVAEYGEESYELDALEPRYIENLIRQEIEKELDSSLWSTAFGEQETEREQINRIIERWEDLQE